jgi:hypothetical protein
VVGASRHSLLPAVGKQQLARPASGRLQLQPGVSFLWRLMLSVSLGRVSSLGRALRYSPAHPPAALERGGCTTGPRRDTCAADLKCRASPRRMAAVYMYR